MLNYEIIKLILQSLGLTINSKFIIPIIILFVIVIICAAVIWVLSIRRKKKKELVLKSTSFDIIKRKKSAKFSINSYTLDDLNNDLKPFGFAYYPPQDYFYSIMYGWQSEYGYCELYDEGSAGLSMIIDCEPIYFNYGGKKWLIEFWKGQYGMNSGCEIGIYTTTGPNLNIPGVFNGTFYYCAKQEDHLEMAFSMKKNGKEIFHRREVHWWLTGFKLGEYSWPSELTVDIEITLKDSEMLNAFVGGLLKVGYTNSDLTINGNTVSLLYDVPHSPQPLTRAPSIEDYMQLNNKRNCSAYNLATNSYKNTIDKLNYVKHAAPKLYHKILNIGSTKELFKIYDSIRKFLGKYESVRNIDKINGVFFKELPEGYTEIVRSELNDLELPDIESDNLGVNDLDFSDLDGVDLGSADSEMNDLELFDSELLINSKSKTDSEYNTRESSEFHDEVNKL